MTGAAKPRSAPPLVAAILALVISGVATTGSTPVLADQGAPDWTDGSGRNLPAPLVFSHDGRLFRWMPGASEPVEISGRGWGRPVGPVMADDSGETFYFAAYAVHRQQGRTGVNINVSNIFRQTPGGTEMITRDWDVATAPDVSRDNRTIVFTSNHHAMLRQVMPMTVTTEIYILQRPWLLPKRLTMDGGFKFNPRLSPDGLRVVYTWIQGSEAGLHVYDIARRSSTRVGPPGDYPTWMPDGSAITFGMNGKLWSLDLDAGAGGQPEEIRVEPEGTYVAYPRWTDHGLLYSWSRSGRSGVALWDPARRSSRSLVSGTGDFAGSDLADAP